MPEPQGENNVEKIAVGGCSRCSQTDRPYKILSKHYGKRTCCRAKRTLLALRFVCAKNAAPLQYPPKKQHRKTKHLGMTRKQPMATFTQCDLTFTCRQVWSRLQKTTIAEARYCDSCDKNVFAVRTRAQLDLATAVGRCVALTDENDVIEWIGQSEIDWLDEETVRVSLRIEQALAEEAALRLRRAFPRLETMNGAFQPGAWLSLGTFLPRIAATIEAEIHTNFPGIAVQIHSPE